MCEHEKSTLLHLVPSLAYHTRLITAASTGECTHRGHARTKSLSSDKDRVDGKSKDRAHRPELLKYNPRIVTSSRLCFQNFGVRTHWIFLQGRPQRFNEF